jgi:hypothetical protein
VTNHPTSPRDLKRHIRTLLRIENTGLRLVWEDSEYEPPDGPGWDFRDGAGCYATGGEHLPTLEAALDYARHLVEWRLEHPEDYGDDLHESMAMLELLGSHPEAIWRLPVLGRRSSR